MRLTPVILSYNHPELTARCVTSVLEHFNPDYPIYLIHNGTMENTEKLLRAQFPQIQHLTLTTNHGFSGGANFGLSQAFNRGAQAVLFLTNDTTVESVTPEDFPLPENGTQRSFLIAPVIERRQTGKIDSIGGRADLFRGELQHLEFIEDPLPPNFYVPGTAFVLSRKAWRETGHFDESLGTYWEDVDYSFRARERGVYLGVAPEIVLRHGVGKTCHKNPMYTVFYYHRNRRKVTWRHGQGKERLRFSIAYSVSTLGKVFKFVKNNDIPRLKLLLRSLIS